MTKATALCTLLLALASASQAETGNTRFAVSVALHMAAARPATVAQLCGREARPLAIGAAIVQVDCPDERRVAAAQQAGARPPEVLVTF